MVRYAGKVAAATLGVAVVGVAAGCAPTPAPQYQYGANAFGSSLTAAGLVNSGQTFLTTVGCTTKAGVVGNNRGAATSLGPFGSVGAITTRVTTVGGSTVASNGTTDVANVRLLGGLVTADAIHLASATNHSKHGFAVRGSTTFVNLKVLGVRYPATIRPNTAITLPGIGTITLNEQVNDVKANTAGQRAIALHIRTNRIDVPGLPLGADVVVGQATSGLSGPVSGRLNGIAYGTNLKVGSLLSSGPSAPAYLPCRGTDGKLGVNTTAGVSLPGLASIGAVTNTDRGTLSANAGNGETTSTIAGVNLLSSLVTADAIKADARIALVNGKRTTSSAGSRFLGLRVRGLPAIGDNVKPNTKVNIAGIGTLYLNRVVQTPTSMEIRMVELVLSTPQGGLPVGADIKIGVAQVGLR